MPDLGERLRTALPELFTRVLGALDERAQAGDAAARAYLEQIAQAPAAACVRVTGEGGSELAFVHEHGILSPVAAVPAGSYGHALALPAALAARALAAIERGAVPLAELGRAWAALVSTNARGLLATMSFGFELVVTSVPEIGELRAAVGLGRVALGAPEFVLTVDYEELEDAREQGLGPQQLFLAGKVRIDGDVAKAMMLGMTLAQLK